MNCDANEFSFRLLLIVFVLFFFCGLLKTFDEHNEEKVVAFELIDNTALKVTQLINDACYSDSSLGEADKMALLTAVIRYCDDVSDQLNKKREYDLNEKSHADLLLNVHRIHELMKKEGGTF